VKLPESNQREPRWWAALRRRAILAWYLRRCAGVILVITLESSLRDGWNSSPRSQNRNHKSYHRSRMNPKTASSTFVGHARGVSLMSSSRYRCNSTSSAATCSLNSSALCDATYATSLRLGPNVCLLKTFISKCIN